ncbi:hypothetical protein [Altericista sp. CCNU0014]|uniref:hypothetical protein n=1 Tax=Altericista sp. CCNU0014 TaxID=3082949 RepID=UPI00384F0A67
MPIFQPGQIVKHGHGLAAHYAVVLAENRTVGWTTESNIEVKLIDGFSWEVVKVRGNALSLEQIKANIRAFKESLAGNTPPRYHLTEFNCEHWATLMVTGRSYSTQSGSVKFGVAEIVGGAMAIGGASAGTVVSIASAIGAAASTGTAIGSLSGAAATNAAMAWLGGGAVAAGGGGMATGSAILATVSTGGMVIAVAGVGIITKQVWDNLDEAKRQEIIETVDRATPDQIKVFTSSTSEALQQFVAESAGWLGEQSSQLAQSVQAAMPHEFKKQIHQWMGSGQAAMAISGEMTGQILEVTQEKARELFQGATQRFGRWFTD